MMNGIVVMKTTMTTIAKRSDGRFEIRESRWTDKGPRSRTLAIFRELTPEVLDHAQRRAERPIDRNEVVTRAMRLGLHVKRILGSGAAAALIAKAESGSLWPTHARAVQEAVAELDSLPLPDHLESMIRWMGADDEFRGRTLVDLLGFTHAVVRHRAPMRTGPLRFPRLPSAQ
jgi:hypothetical protein